MMCYGCWEEFGKPVIDNPVVREAARAVARVYEFSSVGGNLHVIIDDWNVEDEFVLPHDNDPIAENIHEAGPEQLGAERYCLGLLRLLTEEERASALALRDGFWGPGAGT